MGTPPLKRRQNPKKDKKMTLIDPKYVTLLKAKNLINLLNFKNNI